MLSLSFINPEGLTQYQFDVDSNGSWDFRRTTEKSEIFLDGKWIKAELIDPPWKRAKTATTRYSFEDGLWEEEKETEREETGQKKRTEGETDRRRKGVKGEKESGAKK